MAVVTRKGPPDLMITFAANPAWPEIVANLLPGQTGMDRPDLVNRVFKIKLRELLKDLKSNVFTKQLYGMYVCEYQARGLVHAHIIVKFDGDGPQRSNEVDTWVWTNLPDESIADGTLREKVIKYMVNKTCGTVNPSAPCKRTDSKTKRKYCQKRYPQPFSSVTNVNTAHGRAEYRRLDNRDTAEIKQKNGENKTIAVAIDNRDIVPYSPWLLMKYDACLLYTSPSPRDLSTSRMPSSA